MKEILGLIRHILTFGGGFLVASGDVSEAELQDLVGALVTTIGIVWSVVEKRRAAGKSPIPSAAPLFLIPLVGVFLLGTPMGCVRGPDGQVQMDPEVGDFLKKAAQTAALVGVTIATDGVSELTPFAPQLIKGVSDIFNQQDAPEDIGRGLQDLFKSVALEIGDEELEKILSEYVANELTPDVPGSDVGGAAQYQFNKAIIDSL